jgi:predicted permease
LLLNRSGFANELPACFYRTADMLGSCAIPCGLLLVGLGVPALLEGFRIRGDARITLGAIALRNGLIPALFVLGGLFMGLPHEVSRVLILQAAMPAGMFSIVMCQHHRMAPQVALRVVVATTLAAAVSLPIWLGLGAKLQAAG